MIQLILLATLGVVATFAAPQAISTVAPVPTANVVVAGIDPYYRNGYVANNVNGNYDPYYRNNYDPYYRAGHNNGYYKNNNDPYYRTNNYDPYYNKNNYAGVGYTRNYDPSYRNNNYDPYYKNNYFGGDYNRTNYYNADYRKNYVPGAEAGARIVRYENNFNLPEGGYQYGFDTDNGISAQQQGFPIVGADNEPSLGVTGYFSYTAPDGRPVYTRYIADDNGYRTETSDVPPNAKSGAPIPVGAQRPIYSNANPIISPVVRPIVSPVALPVAPSQ